MTFGAPLATWHGARIGRILLLPAAGTVTLAATAVLCASGLVQPAAAAAFGLLIAGGELARVRLVGNRESAPVAAAAGLAYALLLGVGPTLAVHGTAQVITVMAGGTLLGAAPHAAAGRRVHPEDIARRVLVVATVAIIFRPLALTPAPPTLPPPAGWMTLALLAGVVLVAGVTEVVLATLARAGSAGGRLRTAARDELRIRVPLGTAVAATALLLSVAAPVMGWSALVACVAPLVVTQVAYRRYAGIRATYLQTIRALSRVPEVGGYVEDGHSRRVSQLALRLGREIGMSERELLDLEYAALMHDIGQLSLRDPNPAGATVHVSSQGQERIAELGAEVVRQAGVLDRVAEIVQHQADPYRPTEGPPLESRIIRVANAYDDLTGGVAEAHRSREALSRIRLGQGYDPRIVEALADILDRDWGMV